MRFRIGIRAQLGLGIALTTLAGIGFIGLMSIKIVEQRAVYWKTAEVRSVVRFVEAAATRFRSPEQRSRVEGLVVNVLKDMGVRDFRITGPKGEAMLAEGSLPMERGRPLSYFEGIKVDKFGGGWFWNAGGFLYVRASFDRPGAVIGRLAFTLPIDDITKDLAGVKKFLLLYVIIDSAIIIGFGFFFLSGSIINPIRKLTDTAMRIAGGSFGERVDISSDNEIGSLAASFNKMAERLGEEIKTLERVNKDLVAAQAELLRSSTLAAVGRLAAGIAHEIGNPLGAVGGYLNILERGLGNKEEEAEILRRTALEVSRIDSIVRDFLELSRPEKGAAEPVDVNKVLLESLSALEAHEDFKGIEVNQILAEDIPPVIIHEGKLRQVFINLLVNAAQSMTDGTSPREITLESGVEMQEVAQRRHKRRKGDRPVHVGEEKKEYRELVFVKVKDRGSGIGREDAGKIFDPFFTTKEVGKGTGLGLFVSESIIKTYGGEIDFQSVVGEGSTFTVKLPVGRG
ncbi:MAG: HAMP domain-containing sensor histidine kinase [Thermodesulfobacteriota bacterium]|nr:MAG: HAMP domain-containing sensor histidine kinase [Thermodesulfobacteriota bacterium]